MREYFRGWKRKLGVVTLVLACVFAAVWMRTFPGSDFGYCDIGFNRLEYLNRAASNTVWTHLHTKSAASHGLISKRIARGDVLPLSERVDHQYINCGIYFKTFDAVEASGFVLSVPTVFLAVSLTLLSAWLLLPKLRTSPPKPAPEP